MLNHEAFRLLAIVEVVNNVAAIFGALDFRHWSFEMDAG